MGAFMSTFDPLSPFLQLAEQLFLGKLPEADLPSHAVLLPALDQETLGALTTLALTASLTAPRRGWAIATAADLAAQCLGDTRLQAFAAFHLARAANEWVRPDRVMEAVARARAGFVSLTEPGWVAACDWQLYAQPWTRNDFAIAVQQLTAALAELQQATLAEWVPHCQLSLAYAHILRGEFELAQKHLQQSEQTFAARGDTFSRARCWLSDASCLRRQGHFENAFARLHQALAIFQALGVSPELGKTHFQLGYYFLGRGEYATAESHFLTAIEFFAGSDLPLWEGQCASALAEVYNNMGSPHKALQKLVQAGEIYKQTDILGLQADNLLNQARQHMLQAEYPLSLNLLRRAEEVYERIQVPRMSALAALYQGEVCLFLTQYQQALHHLERAYTRFHVLDEPYRQAESNLYLAQGWLALGHWEIAHTHLETAITRFRQTSQFAYLAQALNQLGVGFLIHNQPTEALPIFEEALAISRAHHIDLHAISAQLHMGESLTKLSRYEEAAQQLEQAIQFAREKAISTLQQSCLLALAEVDWRRAHFFQAQRTWTEALALNQESVPGLAWQAHAGLGRLAVQTGDPQTALMHYRVAGEALRVLRQDFWQPHLAGRYLQERVGKFLDQAALLAATHGTGEDLLAFIETSKAQTLVHQLTASKKGRAPYLSEELEALKKEITHIQDTLRAPPSEPILVQRVRNKALHQQLRTKNQAYHDLQSRLERQTHTEENSKNSFSLSSIRTSLGTHLGENWVSVAYYLTENALFGVILSPTQCDSWHLNLSSQARETLTLLTHAQGKVGDFSPDDLDTLSQLLFPATLLTFLEPNTCLIISPHQALNKIPWAMLSLPGTANLPLVTQCVPLCVPSLQVLEQLAARPKPSSALKPGLALALSAFQDQRPALPYVLEEVHALQHLLGEFLQVRVNAEATWESLLAFAQKTLLPNLAFLHLATHAFHDPQTGRMAGLALADQDIWLDQFWDLAPLPPLITLSACYGLQSRIYEGEEHLSLAATCLAAQANHVIGSLWPVLDLSSAPLMLAFYRYYLQDYGVAQALALAQRERWALGATGWEGFLCVGLP